MSRILLVDHHAQACKSLESMLQSLGHETGCAYDGASAIAQLQMSAVDLIILNLELPRMDGWQVLQWLRGRPSAPRVIILSRLSEAQWKLAKQLGASECVATRAIAVLGRWRIRWRIAHKLGWRRRLKFECETDFSGSFCPTCDIVSASSSLAKRCDIVLPGTLGEFDERAVDREGVTGHKSRPPPEATSEV